MTDEGEAGEPRRKSRKSLKKAVAEVAQVQEQSPGDKLEAQSLDAQAVLDRKSSRDLREKYAKHVYLYLIGYSTAAFLLIVAHGFRLFGFNLEMPVLALLVGSTAVSAIGLVGIVVKGLFK